MKSTRKLNLLTTCGVLAIGLAACEPAKKQKPAPAPQQPQAESPIPNIGMSPDVSNAAVEACSNALDAQTEGTIEVVASEFSQANSAVYMVVGPLRGPWRCLVANDGRGPELMFIGSEGSS